MNLVDEYLRAVALQLPPGQRDDIVDELRDTILSRIEVREREAGRSLADDEIEAILREVGHPLVISARYRGGAQHVVGPALYPYWVFAVKVAIAIQCVITLIVWIVRTAIDGDILRALIQAIGTTISGGLLLIGIATVVAWVIERHGIRVDYLDRWRVRDLRTLGLVAWNFDMIQAWFADKRRRAPVVDKAPTPRRSPVGTAIGDLVGGTVIVLWWLGILHFGQFVGPVRVHVIGFDVTSLEAIDWVALKATMFWPVLGYGLLVIVKGAAMLARPYAIRLHGAFELAAGATIMAIGTWLWTDSLLAPYIRVDSIDAFAHRVIGLTHGNGDVVAACLMIGVASWWLFGGLCLAVSGLMKLVVGGAPKRAAASPPVPI